MSKAKMILLALAALLTISAAAGVPQATDPKAWEGLTPEQVKKVKAGGYVIIDQDTSGSGDQKRFIQSAMLVDQPLEKVWTLIKKTENQHRYLPDLEDCELVSRDAKGDKVDFHVEILVVEIDYRIIHHYEEPIRKLWWHLDPSHDNDMNQVDGFWQLYQYNDKQTLMRYGTKIEVASFVPDAIMERLTKSNLPANMEAFYKYIQSGGTYVKPDFEDD